MQYIVEMEMQHDAKMAKEDCSGTQVRFKVLTYFKALTVVRY